jgi:hypothetical protein
MAMSVRPCPGCSAVPAGIADACLREQNRAEMVKCIRLCLDPHRYLRRHPRGGEPARREYDAAVTRPLLEACVAICKSCGDECERHSRQRALGR